MKINITYWLALSYLLAGFSIKGQNYSLTKADSLFRNQSYESAATAYERTYFFSIVKEERITALLGRASAFKNLGRHYEAYNSLARITNFDLEDSLKCSANYQLALNLYLANYFADAEKYCAKNLSIPINSTDYKNSLLLHGFIYNELNKYKNAAFKFQEYTNSTDLTQVQKDSVNAFVKNYYHEKNLPKLKSLRKARRLSKVLPGAGLFYAGKPGKALANIGFQLFAVGYTGANLYFSNYITAASAGLFLIRAFYTGGINQLNEVVPKVNYTRSQKFNDTFKSAYTNQLKKHGALN